jgi:hypothetical protein
MDEFKASVTITRMFCHFLCSICLFFKRRVLTVIYGLPGVQEEPYGDSEEVDGAYGQS